MDGARSVEDIERCPTQRGTVEYRGPDLCDSPRFRSMIYCSGSDKNPGPEVPWPYFTVQGRQKISALSEKTENCLATRQVPVRLGRRDDAL